MAAADELMWAYWAAAEARDWEALGALGAVVVAEGTSPSRGWITSPSASRAAASSPNGQADSTSWVWAHGDVADASYGSGLSFRDPDDIALELFAPPS